MIRVKVAGLEFIFETATEAADFLVMHESRTKADSHNFDIRYFPGGKRPAVICDGYDFIMAIRPIQGKEVDSNALAKHFQLKGIQGLGPFLSRMNKQLKEVSPPRALREFIEKRAIPGKPTFWKILPQKKSKVLFGPGIR